MERSGSSFPVALSVKPKYLNSGQEVCSLVKSWHGALPESREELDLEELVSRSGLPFSEHCPLSDFT